MGKVLKVAFVEIFLRQKNSKQTRSSPQLRFTCLAECLRSTWFSQIIRNVSFSEFLVNTLQQLQFLILFIMMLYYKMWQLFYCKMWQEFITKLFRLFITNCIGLITKWNCYYRIWWFVLQNLTIFLKYVAVIKKCVSTKELFLEIVVELPVPHCKVIHKLQCINYVELEK